MKTFQLLAPSQITGTRHRIGISRNQPTTNVLATRSQLQGLRSPRAEPQNPVGEPLCVDEFARPGCILNDHQVRIACVLVVKSSQYLVKSSSKFHGDLPSSQESREDHTCSLRVRKPLNPPRRTGSRLRVCF